MERRRFPVCLLCVLIWHNICGKAHYLSLVINIAP
uniref:Uncharacterized protein n=1 Tax=Arundo donax TaxID=35708 RepID=A0A0A8Y510_ARUDO